MKPILAWRVRQALFVLMVAFVAYVNGPASPLWPWNAAPIVLSYLLLAGVRRGGSHPGPAIAFFTAATGSVLLVHAVVLEQGEAAAPVGLGWLPLVACALGGVAWFGASILIRPAKESADD